MLFIVFWRLVIIAEFLCCFFPQHTVACFPDNTASLGEKAKKKHGILINFKVVWPSSFLFCISPCCPVCIREELCKNQKGCSAVILKFFPAVMPRKCLLILNDQ